MEVELPSVVACTEGFSTNKLVQFNIEDIDSEDVDDPQVFLWNFSGWGVIIPRREEVQTDFNFNPSFWE